MQLTPHIEGPDGAHTLFFIQGWPDDCSVWENQVAALRGRYRCVRIDLPAYRNTPSSHAGPTTEEILDMLVDAVRRASPSTPVTLITHDWGAFWGYILHHRHPELVARLVGLDIAPWLQPSAGAAVAIAAYQSWLAGAFLLGGPIGDFMTRSLARVLRAPNARRSRAAMNYPYRNAAKDLASGRLRRLTAGYRPTVPLLFAYGTRKAFPFHAQRWLDYVERIGGKVAAMDCDHWLQQSPAFTALLVDWLQRTDERLQE